MRAKVSDFKIKHNKYLKAAYKCGFNDVLMQWMIDLDHAYKTMNTKEWNLAGRAIVLLEEDDSETVSRLVHAISDSSLKGRKGIANLELDFNLALCHITMEQFKESDESLPISQNEKGIELVYIDKEILMKRWWTGSEERQRLSERAVKSLTHWIMQSSPDRPVVFVLSLTEEEYFLELAPELRQMNLIDRRIHIREKSSADIGKDFIRKVGIAKCDNTILGQPKIIGNVLKSSSFDNRRIGLLVIAMRRLAFREQRKLSFTDMVAFVANGTSEYAKEKPDNDLIHRVAVHEAGHALIAIMDSDGKNIPDYVDVISCTTKRGCVVDSYTFRSLNHGKRTFRQARHEIRISLAGRAAEEIVLGVLEIDCYSSLDDLKRANIIAKELFNFCGISPQAENAERSGNNLLVSLEESETHERHRRTDKLVASYLEQEFLRVKSKLVERLDMLNAITEALTKKTYLAKSDLIEIIKVAKLKFSNEIPLPN